MRSVLRPRVGQIYSRNDGREGVGVCDLDLCPRSEVLQDPVQRTAKRGHAIQAPELGQPDLSCRMYYHSNRLLSCIVSAESTTV